ncbi:hypothetical protein MMC12_004928 [Toensbergia leucococca]|nr:hypothetical protein [Toensbergia leucococca]
MESPIVPLNDADLDRHYFRLLDLPSELRNKILAIVLLDPRGDRTIDLDPLNYRRILPRLDIFLVSRRIHEEAYHVFYGGHTFRIFPIHGRFFGNKVQPLLSRLPPRYRAAILSLELRLGPGWSNPPMSWKVNDQLGLEDARAVRKMKVFVECDPSHEIFKGFRVNKEFFTNFSGVLLEDILRRLPVLEQVEFDGYPTVRRGILMSRLQLEAKRQGMRIVRGPEWIVDSDAARLVDQFSTISLM